MMKYCEGMNHGFVARIYSLVNLVNDTVGAPQLGHDEEILRDIFRTSDADHA